MQFRIFALIWRVRVVFATIEDHHKQKMQRIEEDRFTVQHHHIQGRIVTDDDLHRLETCRYMNG